MRRVTPKGGARFFPRFQTFFPSVAADLINVLSSSPSETAGVIAAENVERRVVWIGPRGANHFHKHRISILLFCNAWVSHWARHISGHRGKVKTENDKLQCVFFVRSRAASHEQRLGFTEPPKTVLVVKGGSNKIYSSTQK